MSFISDKKNLHDAFIPISKRTHNDTQHQNSTHSKPSLIDYEGVQLTHAQRHMEPVSTLEYREYGTIQLKYTFEE